MAFLSSLGGGGTILDSLAGAISGGISKPDYSTSNRIRTPHAAVLIWNYVERMGSTPASSIHKVEPTIISTVSCVGISTTKSKSDPQGTFNFVLAPTKNWVGTITPGSWCAILMSNKSLTENDFSKVDPKKLKMIGKIDSVRLDTKVDDTGARTTMYYVTGVDWGHVFHNMIYIDNNLSSASSPASNLGNPAARAIQQMLEGSSGTPERFDTVTNISSLLEIFGKELAGFTAAGTELNLVANAVYNFNIPQEMSSYLNLIAKDGSLVPTTNINGNINLITGALKTTEDIYTDTKESYGFVDPFSLQGAHSFWQVLMDNSNPTMNEMFAEMRPTDNGTKLILYNRIKPFAIQGSAGSLLALADPLGSVGALKVISYFQNIKTHELDPMTVISVNAGTNWKDKYNFAEIKPNFLDERILEPAIKSYTQAYDLDAFQREGFRPIIFGTKQFPSPTFESPDLVKASWIELKGWVNMLKLWYFDTHKMLNGTLIMTGPDGYMAVGDNIKFDAQLLNPSKNFSSGQSVTPLQSNVLAHIESITNTFSVNQDGTRNYTTTIQFVRGIIVGAGGLSVNSDFSAGALESNAQLTIPAVEQNRINTIINQDPNTPKER